MINKKIKKAFSLLEVIFVLVILGVVASISSQIIVQVYENYITQKAVYNVSTKTELVANQIVNRLTYRIQGTTISKDHDTYLARTATGVEDTDWKVLDNITPVDITGANTQKYTTIEWIGYDNDSFAAKENPAWSGIADFSNTNTNTNQFVTPGSTLTDAVTIMDNLSNGQVDLTTDNPAAVIFATNNYTASTLYAPMCMGLIQENTASNTDCIFAVRNSGNNILQFVNAPNGDTSPTDPKIIGERYKLAWSAYAIAPERNTQTGLHDLVLFSNYQPWNGDNYLDATKKTLLRNVSVFKLSENGGTIQFKLCAVENIGQDFNITTCKEKVVIR